MIQEEMGMSGVNNLSVLGNYVVHDGVCMMVEIGKLLSNVK